MDNMFSTCSKLTSLNIGSFNTINCKNFTNMFENDNNLELYLNYQTCSNLKNELPSFIKPHDINEN